MAMCGCRRPTGRGWSRAEAEQPRGRALGRCCDSRPDQPARRASPEAQPRSKRAPSAAGVTGNSGCISLTAASTAASRAASSAPGRGGTAPGASPPRAGRRPAHRGSYCAPSRRGADTPRACTARRGAAGRPRGPGRIPMSTPAPRGIAEPRARLVVRQIRQRGGPGLDPVADGGPRVAHAPSRNQEGPDGDRARTTWCSSSRQGTSRSITGNSGGER